MVSGAGMGDKGDLGTGLISLQSKGLSGVFSNTTVQKHQFFGPRLLPGTLGNFPGCL